MSTPQKVHLCIVLAGAGCLIAATMCPYGVPLILGWVILGNIIACTLKCEKCGRRLTTSPNPFVTRGWGWGVCGHCDHRQEK